MVQSVRVDAVARDHKGSFLARNERVWSQSNCFKEMKSVVYCIVSLVTFAATFAFVSGDFFSHELDLRLCITKGI